MQAMVQTDFGGPEAFLPPDLPQPIHGPGAAVPVLDTRAPATETRWARAHQLVPGDVSHTVGEAVLEGRVTVDARPPTGVVPGAVAMGVNHRSAALLRRVGSGPRPSRTPESAAGR